MIPHSAGDSLELELVDLLFSYSPVAGDNVIVLLEIGLESCDSLQGAAFGFSTIATQAGEQLAPYMGQIVPRLYRYQFDPNPRIQQAMSGIWSALVKDNKKTVSGRF